MILSRLLVILSLLVALAAPAFADDTYVKGYTKRDGTYVAPHWRSAPDSSYNNNGSAYSNVNPYTGQQGTHQPLLYDSNPGYGSGQGSNSRIRPAERPSAVGR